MKTLPLLFACLIAIAGANACAGDLPNKVECGRFANIRIPKRDFGDAAVKCYSDAPDSKAPDSVMLYYGRDGSGKNADYRAARECAYRERAAEQAAHAEAEPYSGSAILMMIYANGRGVPRNIPLAKRFACELGYFAVDARLAGIDRLATKNPPQKAFDVCDDALGSASAGYCALRGADFEAVERQQRFDALAESWTAEQVRAFALLRKAANDWFDVSSTNEVDRYGGARGLAQTEASEKLKNEFLDSLERFEKGAAPEPGAAAFKAEDASLNAAYSAWMHALTEQENNEDGSVASVRAGPVRASQRRWLAYREAWVAFAAARYPHVPADAWRAWLSHERALMIKESAGGG